MENRPGREAIWAQLDQPWDLVVVGGGITGAGILREAARMGVRALLVEARDFAWGSSSRSSKLVHGGLRYLKEGQLGLTRDAVCERERLLREAPGLVEPLGFLLAAYAGVRPGRWLYRAGLVAYDALAGRWQHRAYAPAELRLLAPHLRTERLLGGFGYGDAQTDDARLVLRVLAEARAAGALALNYAEAEGLLREGDRVVGLRVRDRESDRTVELRAGVVVNATGARADRLRGLVGMPEALRPLRGSHLVFPAWRLPVAQAITFGHPHDGRPVFLLPWEGVTLVGTTDLDHDAPLDVEPALSPQEASYLMAAVTALFPALDLTLADVSASFAGVRPVVAGGHADPSKETRDHVVWAERGLLTITGGKLTTFRLIALEALEAARTLLPGLPAPDRHARALDAAPDELPDAEALDPAARARLLGRYGASAPALVAAARPGELTRVAGTPTLWAELRWAARAEAVQHLDDLLLRRTRLGLLLPEGGAALLPELRALCQTELGWDDTRWTDETMRYRAIWRAAYAPPDPALVPDWRAAPAAKKRAGARRRSVVGLAVAGGLSGAGLALALLRRWRHGTRPSPL
ncbi:MAG TPA: glycerol-3-phosphate dehydrogenase/oxidase [Roseiflexaceae bacterium]|nr:glycerol-3-phosphate dehydrogenase/oxidase [Roseiflexaceae bacterium]